MLPSERAETVDSSGAGSASSAAEPLQSSDSTVVEIAPATVPEAVDPAMPGEECVICFAELDSAEQQRRLECGHVFHAACVGEWIAKDGRCPVCRHVIDALVADRAQVRALPPSHGLSLSELDSSRLGELGLPGRPSTLQGDPLHIGDAILLLLSRRLMVFATMEAALSALYDNTGMAGSSLLGTPQFTVCRLCATASSHHLPDLPDPADPAGPSCHLNPALPHSWP